MKSTNGFGANGLPSVDGAAIRPIGSMPIMAAGVSVLARSSKTPSPSSTTCVPSETFGTHTPGNSKLTGSTMTEGTRGETFSGRLEQHRTIINAQRFGSSSTGSACASRTSCEAIPRFLEVVLTRCIAKVARWTRSLEFRAAARAGRGAPVYDIVEAGPRHRFKTITHTVSNCVLGLGYGMGAVKFIDSCKSQGLDLPSMPVEQWPDIDRRLLFILRNVGGVRGDPYDKANQFRVGQIIKSIQTVDAWRQANHLVCEKWKELEAAFKSRAVAGKETVAFRLPSGRIKRYWNPQLAKEPTTEVGEDGREHPSFRVAMRASVMRGGPASFFTGGSLLENIIQATARDLLMSAIVEICDRHPNWDYVFNVYDEVVMSVPDEEAELAEAEIPRLMTSGDHIGWAKGMMLGVDGGVCKKYHK